LSYTRVPQALWPGPFTKSIAMTKRGPVEMREDGIEGGIGTGRG